MAIITALQAIQGLLLRWIRILGHDPITIVELIFGGWAVLWGQGILDGSTTLDGQAWAILRGLPIPLQAWGVALIILGAGQAIGPPKPIKGAVIFGLLLIWGGLAIAYKLGAPYGTGNRIYPIFVAVQLLIWVRFAFLSAKPSPAMA